MRHPWEIGNDEDKWGVKFGVPGIRFRTVEKIQGKDKSGFKYNPFIELYMKYLYRIFPIGRHLNLLFL